MKKTNEQLETELLAKQIVEEQRTLSDKKYAIKLVEKIVFWFIGFVMVAVLGALVSLVVGRVK